MFARVERATRLSFSHMVVQDCRSPSFQMLVPSGISLRDSSRHTFFSRTLSGGGGCALTIISSGNGHAKASKADLVRDMKAEGFRCYESSLGGNGVLWHDKSVPTEFLAVAAGSSSSADEMEGRTGLRVCQSLEGNAGRGMGTERTVVIAAAAAAFGAVVLVGLAQRV